MGTGPGRTVVRAVAEAAGLAVEAAAVVAVDLVVAEAIAAQGAGAAEIVIAS